MEIKRSVLLDEANLVARNRSRFDHGQRTVHKDIIPAKDRVIDYKRKCFGRLFTGIAAGRDKTEERPVSSTTSLNFADNTTQANSLFEEEERATTAHPF